VHGGRDLRVPGRLLPDYRTFGCTDVRTWTRGCSRITGVCRRRVNT